jgi:CBS domain containing-hemolysin-like protein
VNPVWIFLFLGLVLPLVIRRVSPQGWARPGPRNVVLLSAPAAAWLAVASDLSRSEASVRELGPYTLIVLLGLVTVEGSLLLRRRRYGTEGDGLGDPDEVSGEVVETPLSPEAERLLERALGLEEIPVERLMTPSDRVLTAEGGLTAGEVLEEMLRTNRTRVVVVEGSLDRILGIAHAKDLVPLVLEGRNSEPVRRHLRRLLRVPRRVSARRLLEEFRRNRVTIGAVADVRGRTLGVVALNDVFRFIVTDLDGDAPVAEGPRS